jgi:hypothetical protein
LRFITLPKDIELLALAVSAAAFNNFNPEPMRKTLLAGFYRQLVRFQLLTGKTI